MIRTLKRMQEKKAAQENSGGFTLIELLIVIVVLGILAAVVVFSLGGVASSSAQAACQADGSSLNTSMAALQAQYPGTAAVLTTGAGSTGALATTYLQALPNNSTHYNFEIFGGSLYVGGPGATATTSGATAPTQWVNSSGTVTLTGWMPWSTASGAGCKTTGTVSGATVSMVN